MQQWLRVRMYRSKSPDAFEPNEVARRLLIRFLLKLEIININEHWEIIRRYG